MASIADYNRSALDRSLSPALDFMASHPVYSSIGVKSGRRSKSSNRKAGGAKKSQHLLGKALDLDVSRLSNAQKSQLLSDLASYGIKGIGIYDNNNIHIDARKNFATWGPNPKDKYAGVEISQQPKWARQALTAIQQAGPYKAFPAAPAAVPGAASLAIGPAGTSLAEAYQKAQYQRAMPSGPTPPATAPVPTSRPLDSLGGLGAAYRTAALGRVAPSSPAVPVGERFGYPASPASLPAPSRFGAVTAQDDVPMQAQPRSPPMGVVSGPLGPAPATTGLAAGAGTLSTSLDNLAPQQSTTGRLTNPLSTQATAAQKSLSRAMMAGMDSPAHISRAIPSAPVSRVATPAAAPAPVPAQTRSMIAAPAPERFGPPAATRSMVAPAPADMVKAATMQAMPNSPPIGAVSAPLGPMASPAALDAARNLGTAVGAYSVAQNTPAAQAAELSTTPEQAFDTQPAASVQTPAQAAVRATAAARPGGIPAGLAGPWGASIASQRPGQPGPYGFANQTPALDRMTTQSTAKVADPAHPPGFMGKLGDFAQRYGPQIAGTLIGGPVGGLLGGLLGRSFDAAKPGQVLGNPFQGLANTAKAMGMFQSQAPYAGPKTTVGYGTRAIGSVLGGGLPAGATAYSRSIPGYSVTSLGNGVVAKTNQYGFTSYERPGGTGPTAASFSGFSGPGGMFGGGGFFGGGGGQSSGKTSGGRTSGGKSSSSSSKSSGGGATGHSKSSRY